MEVIVELTLIGVAITFKIKVLACEINNFISLRQWQFYKIVNFLKTVCNFRVAFESLNPQNSFALVRVIFKG